MTPAFPEMSSSIFPTVMREETVWVHYHVGDYSFVREGHVDLVCYQAYDAFWPWREENLSPTSGRRVWRIRTFITLCSVSITETMTLSM